MINEQTRELSNKIIAKRESEDIACPEKQVTVITYNQFRQANTCLILAAKDIDARAPYEKLIHTVFYMVAESLAYIDKFKPLKQIAEWWDDEWAKTYAIHGDKIIKNRTKPENVRNNALRKILGFHKWINLNVKDVNRIKAVNFDASLRITPEIEMRSKQDILIDDDLVTLSITGASRVDSRIIPPGMSKAAWDCTMWQYHERGKNMVLDMSYKMDMYKRQIPYTTATYENMKAYIIALSQIFKLPIIPGRYSRTCKECDHCGGKYYVHQSEI